MSWGLEIIIEHFFVIRNLIISESFVFDIQTIVELFQNLERYFFLLNYFLFLLQMFS